MPIYEYVCDACGHEFEELVRSMRTSGKRDCPNCDGGLATQKLSTFAPREGLGRPSSVPLPVGGCGRCGDPNGPCNLP